MRQKNGFTLIELLIVVAIIGILAAIAVPNFMNARVRAQVARTYGDLKALHLAVQSYLVDQGTLPPNSSHLTLHLKWLTTPMAYIASVGFRDIFKAKQGNTGNDQESYLYFSYLYDQENPGNSWIGQVNLPQFSTKGFCLSSWGPDRNQSAIEWVYILRRQGNPDAGNDFVYSPSNGAISGGGIGVWGGDVPGVSTTLGG